MTNVSIDDFRALEKKWYDAIDANGLKKLLKGNPDLYIDGRVSKAVTDTELQIDFFRHFEGKFDSDRYEELRIAWEKFRNTIDVSE